MDRAAYDDYLARLNARDYEGVLACYADELELRFASYRFGSPRPPKPASEEQG